VTFDFLGDDMIARMVRSSIRHSLWQPAKRDEGTQTHAEEAADVHG
jgi:hypothetical protein